MKIGKKKKPEITAPPLCATKREVSTVFVKKGREKKTLVRQLRGVWNYQ